MRSKDVRAVRRGYGLQGAGRLRRIHFHLLLAVLALLLARPDFVAVLAGTALVAAGVGLRVWAAGLLVKGGELCTQGPYGLVRHPLYLGSFVAALGFCVMMNVKWAWLIVLPLFVILYWAQVRLEESYLRGEYGEAHAEYAKRVPMLVPRLGRAAGGAGSWCLSQALANREHRHLLVTTALVGLFFLRALWGANP